MHREAGRFPERDEGRPLQTTDRRGPKTRWVIHYRQARRPSGQRGRPRALESAPCRGANAARCGSGWASLPPRCSSGRMGDAAKRRAVGLHAASIPARSNESSRLQTACQRHAWRRDRVLLPGIRGRRASKTGVPSEKLPRRPRRPRGAGVPPLVSLTKHRADLQTGSNRRPIRGGDRARFRPDRRLPASGRGGF